MRCSVISLPRSAGAMATCSTSRLYNSSSIRSRSSVVLALESPFAKIRLFQLRINCTTCSAWFLAAASSSEIKPRNKSDHYSHSHAESKLRHICIATNWIMCTSYNMIFTYSMYFEHRSTCTRITRIVSSITIHLHSRLNCQLEIQQ